jgi:hypothetical protein
VYLHQQQQQQVVVLEGVSTVQQQQKQPAHQQRIFESVGSCCGNCTAHQQSPRLHHQHSWHQPAVSAHAVANARLSLLLLDVLPVMLLYTAGGVAQRAAAPTEDAELRR